MNDLAGLDWNSSSSSASKLNQSQPQSQAQYSAFKPAVSTTSIPRISTPVSSQVSGTASRLPARTNVSAKGQGLDSFASLLGPSAAKTPPTTLSLQERQKQVLADKTRQSVGQVSKPSNSYHATDAHFWEGLGSGRDTPTVSLSCLNGEESNAEGG